MTPPRNDQPLDADALCDAASSLFYAIVRTQSRREGHPIELPPLMSPTSPPRCPCSFPNAALRQAEAFLLRLGFIERRASIDPAPPDPEET